MCQHPTGHILSAKMSHEVKPDSRDGKQMGDWLSMFHLEFSQLQHQRSRVPRAPAPGKPLGLVTLGADTLLGEKQQSHIARCRQGSWARSPSIASSDPEPWPSSGLHVSSRVLDTSQVTAALRPCTLKTRPQFGGVEVWGTCSREARVGSWGWVHAVRSSLRPGGQAGGQTPPAGL